ncbi:peptidase M28 [Natranaerobius thermophilus JW/NM-WN-LF]|uniref:Carboxypeptidase Q n=2 Tax=Natranaerobius TaxID=375928 RepID=B2A1J8_NATTJ|nr:peptidase M28 [Natranaerobius thermophilus JW/NM-WN-LF]
MMENIVTKDLQKVSVLHLLRDQRGVFAYSSKITITDKGVVTMEIFESDGLRMYEDIVDLAALGDRFAGSTAEKEAGEIVKKSFIQSGLEVYEESFDVFSFYEKNSQIKLRKPLELTFDTRAMYYSPGTHKEGLQGELVYVKNGLEQDYEGKDVEGKIVIFHRDDKQIKDHFWPEIKTASEKGAIGAILINFDDWEFITTLETGYFEPSKRFLPIEPNEIPSVIVSKNKGDLILDLMNQEKVIVDIIVDTLNEKMRSSNIRGVKAGSQNNNEKILIYGHRDSAGTPGANDNGSGTVIMMELARLLKDMKLNRTIEFLSTGAEEQLGAAGALEYINRHKSELNNIKAAVELDMVGNGNSLCVMKGGEWPDKTVNFPDKVCQFFYEKAREYGYAVEYGFNDFGTPDSGKFASAGVPTTWIWGPDDIYYHSPEDTPEKVDRNKLKIVADMLLKVILDLDKQETLNF